MAGRHGLNDRAPLVGAAAGTSHHLGNQGKGGLGGAEGVYIKRKIRVHHTHQRHIGKVQPLGDHLRTHQNGNLLFPKPAEDVLMTVGGRDGVGIHAEDLGVGKKRLELQLHLLGAGAHDLSVAAADWALRPGGLGIAAVVAQKPVVGGMVGEAHAAPGALGHIAAVHAHHILSRATAV